MPPLHAAPHMLQGGSFSPRLPPIPPPGLPPPPFNAPPKPLMPPSAPHIQSGAVLSAHSSRPHLQPPFVEVKAPIEDSKRATVISAQPQLRNMTAEVTKFMPTSLRVRRNHPTGKSSATKMKPVASTKAPPNKPKTETNRPPPTQGDAYDSFMKEMQGLL